jgi:hypothetical protein
MMWCGRLARLEDEKWRYCRFDATYKTRPSGIEDNAFPRRGG